jgi:hypothetical protein
MKKCGFCAESIQDEAIKCRWCGEMQRDATASAPASGRSRPQSEVVTVKPAVVIGRIADVCIGVPRGLSDLEVVATLREGMLSVARQSPNGRIGLLFLVAETSTPPAGPARAAANEMFSTLQPNICALGGVLEGSGFMAAAKRSVFTFATARVLTHAIVKTFEQVEPASVWLVDRCREQGVACPTAAALAAFAQEVRNA